jgi:hypothetical protein
MTPKAKKKNLILILNALGLTILLLIQSIQADNIIQEVTKTTEFQEVRLKATLLLHNKSTYNWIARICLGLMIFNITLYRQWVKSRKWILEPILILVISYGLTFSFYTYQTFEIRDKLIEEKRIKN